MNSIVYITYGPKAKQEAMESIKGLNKHDNLPITIIDTVSDSQLSDSAHSRLTKVNLPSLLDCDNILYLDADTRVHGDLSTGFQMLDDGWDMVIAPSKNQDNDLFAHIPNSVEKTMTLNEIGNPWPLQLQCGVIFFNRLRCTNFFQVWAEEWQRYKDQDQAAFLRALNREPIRVWLVGRPFNGGELVEHRFGACR